MAEWVKVAERKDIPEGGSVAVECNGDSVAVFNIGGRYYAMADTCPHAGGPLSDGCVENGQVTCPWHGWTFHLDPTKAGNDGITRYPVSIDGDDIKIQLS